MKYFPCFILLLVLVGAGQTAFAQSGAEQQSIRFRILLWDTSLDGVFMHENGRYIPLQAQPNFISHEYTYSGASPLLLYRQTHTAEGAPVYEPFEALALGGSGNYLLIVRRVGAERALQAFLYRYDYERYADADLVLFNLTALPLKAQFGSLLVDIAPGAHRHLARADIAADSYSLRCKIAGESEDGWQLIHNDFVHLAPRAQVLFFLGGAPAGSAATGRTDTQIKRIVDYRLSDAQRKGSLSVSDATPVVGGY